MKKTRYACAVFLGVFLASPLFAADEAVIEDLQSDVETTRLKTDENTNKINELMGGLPAEQAARIAADVELRQLIEENSGPAGSGISLTDANGSVVGAVIAHTENTAEVLYQFQDATTGETHKAILDMEKNGIVASTANRVILYYADGSCLGQAYMPKITSPSLWENYVMPKYGTATVPPPDYPSSSPPQTVGNRNTIWFPDTSQAPWTPYSNPVYVYKMGPYGMYCFMESFYAELYPAQSMDLEAIHPAPYSIQ